MDDVGRRRAMLALFERHGLEDYEDQSSLSDYDKALREEGERLGTAFLLQLMQEGPSEEEIELLVGIAIDHAQDDDELDEDEWDEDDIEEDELVERYMHMVAAMVSQFMEEDEDFCEQVEALRDHPYAGQWADIADAMIP